MSKHCLCMVCVVQTHAISDGEISMSAAYKVEFAFCNMSEAFPWICIMFGDANRFIFFLHVDSVCHVQVMGRSLSPDLMIDISDPADYSNLKYLPGAGNLRPEDLLSSDAEDSSDWSSLVSRYRQMRQLAMMYSYMLLGPVQFADEDDEAEAHVLHLL